MYGVDGSDVFDILIDQVLDKIIEGVLSIIPGTDVIMFIYKGIDFIFDAAGYISLIQKIITNIKESHDVAHILIGCAELSMMVAIPLLILVMIFNITVRLVRRFAKA